ncbi:MAG: hypothetical protein KatS3mg030_550 [Saprospiraceae bacterium]|nr:MAG: hypothetical protein KatS3mg030_550 [Saprospiraceae bacterium]
MPSIINTGFILCLFVCVLCFVACKQDDETMRVERFEFLDRYSGNGVKSDTNDLKDWAYLIHGYDKNKETQVNEFMDNYFCDSLMPNLPTNLSTSYLTLFKYSSNTNRENFNKGRIKHKVIRAKSYDKLAFYVIMRFDDSTLTIYKQKLNKSGMLPNPPPDYIYCE